MNRSQIINQYRQRIRNRDRIKLTTEERSFLVQDFIAQLMELDNPQAIEQLCRQEIVLLEQGYGKASNSTTNYLSQYRKAIEEAMEQRKLTLTPNTTNRFVGKRQVTGEEFEAINHLAWSLMRYDNSVYAANRKATNVGNNQRQDNPQPFVPDRFMNMASQLLQSEEAETLAVGIAAVTGRRHTEVVLSGQFEQAQHPFLLSFDGQLKKDHPVAYSIVTLLPAAEVMAAIDRFRALPQVLDLQGCSTQDQQVKNFRARVNSRVKQFFQRTEILPILPGFQSVSVHRLRGAYARMAIYFWLPNQGANEQRFLQFYLGHVDASEMRDASNSNSTTHYFGYRLVDDQGKPITASGIKLMANPPLPAPTQEQVEQQLYANQQLEFLSPDMLAPDFSDDPIAPSPSTVESIALQLDDLPMKQPALHKVQQNAKPQPKRSATRIKPKYKDLAVNLDLLSIASNRLGIQLPKGKGYQGLLHQVLAAIAADFFPPQSLPVQTGALSHALTPLLQQMADLQHQIQDLQAGSESSALLEREVVSLRGQLQQLQQERDSLQAQTQQVASLQHECELLKTQLQAANDQLYQIRSIALVSEIAPSAQPTTTIVPSKTPPHQPDSQSQNTQLPQQQSQRNHKASIKMSPDQRIALAIQALIHFNLQCSHPHDRWFISGNSIALISRTNPATKVKPWLDSHPDIALQIEHHNQDMGTTQPHHNRGKEKEQLRSIFHAFIDNHNS